MDGLASADVLQFEGFRFDRARGCLTRLDGPGVAEPVALGSRALDVLALLVERHGQLVSKDEIMKTVWPGTAVEEGNLTVQISALRRALDRDRAQGSCIQTVPGRGYRFVAPVTRGDPAATPAVPRPGNGASAPISGRGQLEPRSAACGTDAVLPTPARKSYRLRRAVLAAAAGTLCLVTAVVAAVNWRSLSPWQDRSAPRLSIVVLPFTNLSNDPDQQYFADAVTEDVTTDLSGIAHMFVISRNTAFTYQGKRIDTKQIGRELGVRYVLEGSVRRSGEEVRVNVQLIGAETDAQLWAERFDSSFGDLFGVQNEITGRIANALGVELVAREAVRPMDHPDALDYIFRGRAALLKSPTPDSYAEAIGLFERALSLDPQSAEAQSRLAIELATRVLNAMSTSRATDIARAEALAGQALATSPRSLLAHYAKGQVLRAQNRCDQATPEYETVISSNPNAAAVLVAIAHCKLFTGAIDEVIPLVEQAMRLSPRDPHIFWWYFECGRVFLLQSHTDEAILWLEKARSSNPAHPWTRIILASAYGLKGETDRAAAELVEARRLAGEGSFASISRLSTRGYWGVPKIRALFEATYFAGLRKAGMPEE
jgi:TolB-like protein/DNA-binding winged helix-turn-helix (wHTH) protein